MVVLTSLGSGNTQNPHKIAFFMHTRRLPSLRKPLTRIIMLPKMGVVANWSLFCANLHLNWNAKQLENTNVDNYSKSILKITHMTNFQSYTHKK